MENLQPIIERAGTRTEPWIQFIRRAAAEGRRLGVFASSFNPVTRAHLELMRRAAEAFTFDETLALAGAANADKSRYEASLEDRLKMLLVALEADSRASVGLSSHAFFVDMLEALEALYDGDTQIHFVLGFDTFERLLDRDDKYTTLYHRGFRDRVEALEYLLGRSRIVVAGRAGAGYRELEALTTLIPEALRPRVWYLDFPADLGEQSATQVRERVRGGQSIAALVTPAVERYITERGLYG